MIDYTGCDYNPLRLNVIPHFQARVDKIIFIQDMNDIINLIGKIFPAIQLHD